MSPKSIILIFLLFFLINLPLSAYESTSEFEMVESGKCLVELHPSAALELVISNGVIRTGMPDLDEVLSSIEAYEFRAKAPRYQPDLFTALFDPDYTVVSALEKLTGCSEVEEVYPCPLVKSYGLTLNPNDFLYPAQWHLEAIYAPEAWGIYRGDAEVQVGIIDSGVDYLHPDLAPNIWINPGEDINGDGIIDLYDWNGVDDDDNGYTDDFWGWDWVSVAPSFVWPGEDPGPPDNDPMDFGGHGTHCAGDACAATDNMEGVTSPGFNCRIMCLRAGYTEAGSGQGLVSLDASIDAAYYAIEMGAEVLSMSFGGSGLWAPFENALQAAADSGLVLVAAAGNDNNNVISYPAGYDCVIAVAATTFGDIKADFSSYGTWVDVCAPGDQIFSTIPQDYGNMSGTSMACPITAGLCALVKGLKPEWNYIQVENWLEETADNIDYLNPAYAGQLGGGRINAYKAVDLFITVDSFYIDIPTDDLRLPFNTEASMEISYHMTIGSASNVILRVNSSNPQVHLSGEYNIGNFSAGMTGSAPAFTIFVDYDGEDFQVVEVEAEFSANEFVFSQTLEIPVGYPDVLIVDADQGNTERTSRYYEDALEEMGYSYETSQLTAASGIFPADMFPQAVIAFSGTGEDSIFSQAQWTELQNYFYGGGRLILSGQNIAQDCAVNYPTVLSNFLWSTFIDDHSNDLTIAGNPNYVPAQDLNLVMAGSGGAWNQNSLDVITPLPIAQTVFVYNTANLQNAAGIYWQSSQGKMFYLAFGIEGINDAASSGNTRGEVLQMMFDVFGLSSVPAENAQAIPSTTQLMTPYPNPFNSTASIDFVLAQPGRTSVVIYDVLGREVTRLRDEYSEAGSHSLRWEAGYLASGIYFVELTTSEKAMRQKVLILK